jgi:hypothetical protein
MVPIELQPAAHSLGVPASEAELEVYQLSVCSLSLDHVIDRWFANT